MPIASLIIALVLVGVVLYLLTFIPMDPTIAAVIRVVVIVAVILYVLGLFVPGLSFRLR